MNFQYPLLLLLLLPVALLGWLHHRRSLSFGRRWRTPLVLLAAVCLVVAVANPYWSYTEEKVVVRGVDFVVMLDVSQSMFCMEGPMRRIDRASRLLRTLVPRLSGSSVGVLYFSGDAQIGCPLTPDLGAVPLFLESVTPGMTTRMGSRTAALPVALEELLSAREASRKTVGLLFSDGEFEDGTGPFEKWLNRNRDFTLFSVVCGKTRTQVPELDLDLPHPNAFSQPDPAALRSLAATGAGRSFDISSGAPEALENGLLSNVRETVAAGRTVPDYKPYPFLVLAAAFLLLYQFLPSVEKTKVESRHVLAASLILLLCASPGMKKEEDAAKLFSSALKDIKENKLEQAENKLKLLRQQGASEEVEVALGNARFARGEYDEAIRHYSDAVRRNPGNNVARWNWGSSQAEIPINPLLRPTASITVAPTAAAGN